MIRFIDPIKSEFGHFNIYRKALLQIPDTEVVEADLKLLPQDSNKIKLLLSRICDWRKQISKTKPNEIVHVLFGDLYYTIPFLFRLGKRGQKFVLTMHSVPEGKIKRLLLKNYCKKASVVVAQSIFNKKELESLGLTNVITVDNPSLYDYSGIQSKNILRKNFDISGGVIVISALGGIVQYKGLDILLEAFKYMKVENKKRLLLNIAGRPGYLNEDDIKRKCNEYDIKARLTIRGLSDKEFMENIVISDYVAIPYRKSFTANSGPMTEAIACKVPCIVSDYGNISKIAKTYNVGVCFRSEDAKSLAETIEREIENPSSFCFDYSEKVNKENFIKAYEKIYTSLRNK